MNHTWIWLAIAVAFMGCHRSNTLLSEGREERPGAAGRGRVDAASGDAPDGGALPSLAMRPDSGLSTNVYLAEALRCGMTRDEALDAIMRFVACRDETDATAVALYESWEAGLFAIADDRVPALLGYDLDYGCEGWRCFSASRSCDQFNQCAAAAHPASSCTPGAEVCGAGDRILRCDPDGSGYRPVIDCSSLGMTCVGDPDAERGVMCANSFCAMRGVVEDVQCGESGGSLWGCEGGFQMRCDLWQPDTRCRQFSIGGELPIRTCAQADSSGGLPRDVACSGSVVSFEAAQGDSVRYDCGEHGFSGCDTAGCVP